MAPARAAEPTALAPTKPQQALVGNWPANHVTCQPLPLRSVRVGGFLGGHIDANNRRSLLAGLESPIPKAIEARARGEQPPESCKRLATDSDFHKWLEGACYAITYQPELKDLAGAIDRYADMLIRLQDPDGYLGTRISPAKPFDEKVRHDLYVAGHFFEAAVAHYEATGQRKLLDAAVRLADFYLRAFEQQHAYYKLVPQEHPEIEPALVRLYRATGERRFLDFAAAIAGISEIEPNLAQCRAGAGRRHAVRFCYLLTGLTELYLQTGDKRYLRNVHELWDEIVSTRMYVTGGIGYNETIPSDPFDLPQNLESNPNRDIAETCASVAMMMLSWRLHAITGESRAFDVIETILYNHYLGAISLDHLGNFYYNPLRRVGDVTGKTDHGSDPVRRRRLPQIHSTACCLPNAWRFFAQLPEYVFSTCRDELRVNLYTDAAARAQLSDGTIVSIEMRTEYPHEELVSLRIVPDRLRRFSVGLRIPSWCEGASVQAGSDAPQPAPGGAYQRIEREWSLDGTEIVLQMPMRPAMVIGDPRVAANRGQVAFRRGPLIYCLEKQDADGLGLEHTVFMVDRSDPVGTVIAASRHELGFYTLRVPVGERRRPATQPADSAPATASQPVEARQVTLIPFYFRANRDPDTRWVTFIPFE